MTPPSAAAWLLALLLSTASAAYAQSSPFAWPGGKTAAIVLTYDDGMDTHLDIAAPDLERRGFKGTFFVQGNTVTARFSEWRAVAHLGHEIGNHSLFHPCPRAEFDWVRPEYDSDSYTIRRMLDELRTANGILTVLDGKEAHSLAYMCGWETAGRVSYVDSLRAAGFATYGRSGYDGRSFAASPAGLDPLRVPSWGVPEDSPADSLIAFAESVAESGGLGVFMFHGVGGQWIQVDRDAHDTLLTHLAAFPDRYWVGTFSEVMDHVVALNKAPGQ